MLKCKIQFNERSYSSEMFEDCVCIMIENESGEGKTVMNLFNPEHWIVYVNLSAYTKALQELASFETDCLEHFATDILRIDTTEK